MVSNTYPVGLYFMVPLKGENAAFQEVSGISKELGIEDWSQVGKTGLNTGSPLPHRAKTWYLKEHLFRKYRDLLICV